MKDQDILEFIEENEDKKIFGDKTLTIEEVQELYNRGGDEDLVKYYKLDKNNKS